MVILNKLVVVVVVVVVVVFVEFNYRFSSRQPLLIAYEMWLTVNRRKTKKSEC